MNPYVRCTHASETCLSAYSNTLAHQNKIYFTGAGDCCQAKNKVFILFIFFFFFTSTVKIKLMKKKEVIIVIVMLVFGLCIQQTSAYYMKHGKKVRVTIDKEITDTFELRQDTEKTYTTAHGTNKLVIKDGKAYIESADCANQICVHTAPISDTGQSIACLPHKLIVEVVDE